MKKTWIGRHRPSTTGPIVKPLTNSLPPTRLSVTSLGNRGMRALIFVYTYAQNLPLECLSSMPGLGVVPSLLSEICWLLIRWLTFVAELGYSLIFDTSGLYPRSAHEKCISANFAYRWKPWNTGIVIL